MLHQPTLSEVSFQAPSLSCVSPQKPVSRSRKNTRANRQQSKEIQHPPKRTTPEWSHAAVAWMADGQPSALGTSRHAGSETSVGLPGGQKLYVRRSHMRPEPHHDELHTFRRESERRRHCGNEGWIRAVVECRCRHDMMECSQSNLYSKGTIYLFLPRPEYTPLHSFYLFVWAEQTIH